MNINVYMAKRSLRISPSISKGFVKTAGIWSNLKTIGKETLEGFMGRGASGISRKAAKATAKASKYGDEAADLYDKSFRSLTKSMPEEELASRFARTRSGAGSMITDSKTGLTRAKTSKDFLDNMSKADKAVVAAPAAGLTGLGTYAYSKGESESRRGGSRGRW